MPSNLSETGLRLGCLVVSGDLQSPLPLEGTSVSVQIQGPLATVIVSQRFGNPLTEAAELEYLFPLPHEAALTDFTLKIGLRTVRADLQELAQARQAYEEARASGRRAGLLEQRRSNLFAVSLANILPGEIILAEIRYQERVRFAEDGYEFVFPMGITPRYDSPSHPNEGQGVQVPLARPGDAVGTLELNLAVDAGLACEDPTSPSHPLDVYRLDERRFTARLAGDQIPDRDFVLRYAVAGEALGAAAWASPAQATNPEKAGASYFLATILPPRADSQPVQIQREFIFVLDRSGSMGGEPILQARNALRACLRALNPIDTFRVLCFDDRLEWYHPEPSRVSQTEIEQADAYLAGVDARGGTEIIAALAAALDLPADALRTRFIVFLTDGAVSAEVRALDTLRRKLGAARVFTFGIGPSVNRALLARMAGLGRGESEFLQAGEDIEGAVIRFQDRVSFPVLTDLQLSWQGGSAWDVYPARLPDLYIGQPLEICGCLRTSGPNPVALAVRGRCGDRPFEANLSIALAAQPDPSLARVWARARVGDLLEEIELDPQKSDSLRAAVIGLALEHRLVTPFTAFVALDQQEGAAGQKPRLIRVAQPLPAGLNFDAFQPQAMQMKVAAAAFRMPPQPFPAAPKAMRSMMIQDGDANFSAAGAGSEILFGMSEEAPAPAEPVSRLPFPANREGGLRWLARTQQLDGSWGEDVERTAAALLAFVRAGHTTRTGSFRQAVRRVVEWLALAPGSGFAALARVRALEELAEATREPRQMALAAQAAQALASMPPATPQSGMLDELRQAALAGQKPAAPLSPPDSEPALTWYILTL